MSAGDFSASLLPNVLAKQQEIFVNGGRLNINRNDSRLGAAKAIIQNQTARPLPVMTGDKCTGVEVSWLKYCDQSVLDCDDNGYSFSCDITGTEGESVKETLAPNICIVKRFAVNDDECKDLYDITEKIAEGMANAKLAISAELSKRVIAALYAGASPASAYVGEEPDGWDLGGSVYEYTAIATDRPLTLAQMQVMTTINRVQNPVLIADGTWQADQYLATFLNNNGGAVYNEAGLMGQWGKWYFDPIGMAANTGSGNGKIIMVDPNNVLLWTKNDVLNDSPKLWLAAKSLTNWREPLSYLGNNIKLDAWMQEACMEGANGMRRKTFAFELILRGGFYIGPNACDSNDSGVYYFEKNVTT